MSIAATDLRRGMAIMFNGEPVRVVEFHHHTPGNLRAMVQAKLKKLKSGATFEHRFRAADTIDVADLETHELDYLYHDGDMYHFMNTENYEQMAMSAATLGEDAKWMTEGMRIVAEFFEGHPIGIELPNVLTFEVVDTAPVMKTATKTSSTKPARLNNGVTVNVPEFIKAGESIRVNPQTGEYLDRAK
jgi:elongation factor P